MPIRAARSLALTAMIAVLGALSAPSIALAQAAISIAEALDTTKTYGFVMIEGVITDTKGQNLYRIEDQSGTMIVLIKEHMTREGGPINVDDQLRLWGRIEEKKLDHDTRGMIVSNINRLGEKIGASGLNNPGASADTKVVPIDRSALPAAPSFDPDDVIRPRASEEFIERARGELRAYRQAEADALDAGQAYARVARDSGSSAKAEATALDQLQKAEAQVGEIRGRIPDLVTEARAEGIDESIIKMIEHEAGIR